MSNITKPGNLSKALNYIAYSKRFSKKVQIALVGRILSKFDYDLREILVIQLRMALYAGIMSYLEVKTNKAMIDHSYRIAPLNEEALKDIYTLKDKLFTI